MLLPSSCVVDTIGLHGWAGYKNPPHICGGFFDYLCFSLNGRFSPGSLIVFVYIPTTSYLYLEAGLAG
jgi:hypothetical protein